MRRMVGRAREDARLPEPDAERRNRPQLAVKHWLPTHGFALVLLDQTVFARRFLTL